MKDVNAVETLPLRPRPAARPLFADVAERHLDDVYRYLLVFTRDATLAEDLAAETFERALRSWRRFDPRRAAPRTWLCTIARNVALDHFRAERRRLAREHAATEPQRAIGAAAVHGLLSGSSSPRQVAQATVEQRAVPLEAFRGGGGATGAPATTVPTFRAASGAKPLDSAVQLAPLAPNPTRLNRYQAW